MIILLIQLLLINSVFCSQQYVIGLTQNNVDVLRGKLMTIADPNNSEYGSWMRMIEINDLIGHQRNSTQVLSLERQLKLMYCTIDRFTYDEIITTCETLVRYNSFRHEIVAFVFRIIPYSKSKSYPKCFHHNDGGNQHRHHDQSERVDKGLITRETIMRMYGINEHANANGTSVGIIEYIGGGGFSQYNLASTQAANNQPVKPIANINTHGIILDDIETESELDVQMVGMIAGLADIWFEFYPGWMYQWAHDFFNSETIPYIVSISWGWDEQRQCVLENCPYFMSDREFLLRTDVEFMKLALRGVTVLAASGDAGSPGRMSQRCDNGMNPIYPGSSPYVLSIGGTYIVGKKWPSIHRHKLPICGHIHCATGNVESMATYKETGWTSGAGFSNWNRRPFWQDDVVSAYLNKTTNLPNHFNANGRAYPDISVFGHNCAVSRAQMGGRWHGVDGTSCSTPIFASIIAIINTQRALNNQPRVGFANIWLYDMFRKHPDRFNDIVTGNSACTEEMCCGDDFGFKASVGYDVISGLGSIRNFIK